MNDVKILNTDNMEWKQLVTRGLVIDQRKYFTLANVGRHVLVHGGLGWNSNVLNDICALDMDSLEFFTVQVKGKPF